MLDANRISTRYVPIKYDLIASIRGVANACMSDHIGITKGKLWGHVTRRLFHDCYSNFHLVGNKLSHLFITTVEFKRQPAIVFCDLFLTLFSGGY